MLFATRLFLGTGVSCSKSKIGESLLNTTRQNYWISQRRIWTNILHSVTWIRCKWLESIYSLKKPCVHGTLWCHNRYNSSISDCYNITTYPLCPVCKGLSFDIMEHNLDHICLWNYIYVKLKWINDKNIFHITSFLHTCRNLNLHPGTFEVWDKRECLSRVTLCYAPLCHVP